MVTGLDLQQAEHRGIAVYSKALLRALRESGAELWLLTDFEPKLTGSSLKAAPRGVKRLVFAARVLESLRQGYPPRPFPLASSRAVGRLPMLMKLLRGWQVLEDLGAMVFRGSYNLERAKAIDLAELQDSPYSRVERLFYLDELSGIISARNVFVNSFRAALRKQAKPIRIQLGSFDGLITTCPLHLRIEDSKSFVQTVHDLIPLEFVQTTDHAGAFSRRLASCNQAQRLFVSSSTRQKYEACFEHHASTTSAVVIQPPSLQMPKPHQRRLLESDVLHPSRRAKANGNTLHAFRYLLFNSSVEPRKNLLFVIRAYRQSGLAEQGIRLCVTGQLKRDDYSKAVAEQADDSVLLTGYIDEQTKANLFLHTLGVLSPSLVEGFGIPVLDAACIGAPVIASPSLSHREIQGLHDFQSRVWICDTRDPMDWAVAMKDLTRAQLLQIKNPKQEREMRLERYEELNQRIAEDFRLTVCQQVLNGIQDRA